MDLEKKDPKNLFRRKKRKEWREWTHVLHKVSSKGRAEGRERGRGSEREGGRVQHICCVFANGTNNQGKRRFVPRFVLGVGDKLVLCVRANFWRAIERCTPFVRVPKGDPLTRERVQRREGKGKEREDKERFKEYTNDKMAQLFG